jgi:uncharacterized membrane protein
MMTKRSIGDYLLLGLRGMGMGAADVIPGVSGGTIAFITGIYEELVHSIKSINARLLRTLFSEGIGPAWKQANGTFLATVLTGVLVSIFSLARLISWLLEHHQMLVWAFFFGLIIGSAIHVGRKITNWSAVTVIMLVAGTAIAYYITIATPATTPGTRWFVFVSGAIAISAMILPGISGSFILLLLGQYEFILNAVRDLKADILAIFGAGLRGGHHRLFQRHLLAVSPLPRRHPGPAHGLYDRLAQQAVALEGSGGNTHQQQGRSSAAARAQHLAGTLRSHLSNRPANPGSGHHRIGGAGHHPGI